MPTSPALWRGAIEIKTPTGRQSKEQRMFQQIVEQRGGIYVLCRSVDDARALLLRRVQRDRVRAQLRQLSRRLPDRAR